MGTYPISNVSAQQAKKAPEHPTHKVTFHVLDPISGLTMEIEQEWNGYAEHLAGRFHEGGIMVESPNGDHTWYNPSTIIRVTFKELVEKPRKKQTLFSKTPPQNGDSEPEDDLKDPFDYKNLQQNVPF